MRRPILLAGTVALILFLPSLSLGQSSCGDADGNGNLNIGDIVRMIDYLSAPQGGSPPLNSLADCDNRNGVTISDVSTLCRFLFMMVDERDCNIQSTYTFPQSLTDTVFLPYMGGIPDGVDTVRLPIVTSFATDTRAFYIPCWFGPTNGPGQFAFKRIAQNTVNGIETGRRFLDTVVFLGCDLEDETVYDGRHNFFDLVLQRTAAGITGVGCSGAARSETLRVSVEKGGNLYAPVIQYYEVPVPTPVVTTSPSPLDMEAKAGYWSTVSYPVTFTSDAAAVSFNIAASEGWIVIENLSPAGYTTPDTISVRVNATALLAGTYTGQITFSEIDPADATFEPAVLDVTLTVTEPLVYAPGDLNCSGTVTIGDVMLLIDCLFIEPREIPPCE